MKNYLVQKKLVKKTYFVGKLKQDVDLKELLNGFKTEKEQESVPGGDRQIISNPNPPSTSTQETRESKPNKISVFDKKVFVIVIIILLKADVVNQIIWYQKIAKIFIAIFTTLALSIISGELNLETKIPWLNDTKIKAGGSIAVFVFVILLLWQ